MKVRSGRFGIFLGCTAFPACRHKVSLRAAASRGKRLVVALEMESTDDGGSFRVYILSSANRKRARDAEERACAAPPWHPMGPDAEESELLALLAQLAAEPPGGVGRRADGVLGAVFPLSDHARVVAPLVAAEREGALVLSDIPPSTLRFFTAMCSRGAQRGGTDPDAAAALLARLPRGIRGALLPFQVDGVAALIGGWSRGDAPAPVPEGVRALLADEMGLGKTLQALAVAALLRAFPLIVVCPATLRLVWAEQASAPPCSRVPGSVQVQAAARGGAALTSPPTAPIRPPRRSGR